MNQRRIFTAAAFAAMALAGTAAAQPRVAMGEATAARKAQAEETARQMVQNLFERLCPGRCEIIQLGAVMGEPSPAALVEPGFEEDAPQAYDASVDSLLVEILLDSALPATFRRNIPRMIRYRLQSVAPVIEVRTETLAFPEPQLEPTPPVPREPPRMFAPPLMPPPPPATREEDTHPAPVEPTPAAPPVDDVWTRAVPWVGGVLIALILAALNLLLLRRLTKREEPAKLGAMSDTREPDGGDRLRQALDAIERTLRDKRAVANAALRRWVLEQPEAVARFVKRFGPDVLADLRASDDARPALARVARQLVAHPEPLSEAEESAMVQEAAARFAAAELEEGRSSAWEFLEGLSVGQIQRLLEGASVAERASVFSELPASTRAGLVASLSDADRAELLVGASGTALEGADVRRLQNRLRARADALRGHGRAAGALAGDLLRTVPAGEQVELARQLLAEQPNAGAALLDNLLLERALTHLPDGVIADASMQVPMETLVTFLAGAESRTLEAVLERLPPRTASVVSTELGVLGPVARSRFFDARDSLAGAVAEVLSREGGSVARVNAEAIHGPGAAGVSQMVAAE